LLVTRAAIAAACFRSLWDFLGIGGSGIRRRAAERIGRPRPDISERKAPSAPSTDSTAKETGRRADPSPRGGGITESCGWMGRWKRRILVVLRFNSKKVGEF
jgi:hypothetical protein